MTKDKKNETSGIVDIIIVFAVGAMIFVIINGITLLLTSKPIIYVPIFLGSIFVCFILWPMDRAIASDLKNLDKGEKNGC